MAVVISDSLVLSPPPGGFPLKHAHIGYRSIAAADNVIASNESAGFPGSAAANVLTYDYWLPSSLPATWTIDYGEAVDVDYVGIAAHSFADEPTTVTVEYSTDGSTWTEIASTSAADGTPVMLIFEKTFARYWRVIFDGSTPPQIGVIYVGELLAMSRPFYGGHSPITLSRQTVSVPSSSDSGQFLGVSIVRTGVKTAYKWDHLKAAWYRTYFDPFVKAIRGGRLPFFIAWNPDQFPKEVGFLWVPDDIQPSNMGVIDYMEVSFTGMGISDE